MKQKPKNIILCGFMGSGKTTVGRRLAQKTHMEFLDMDHYIEERAVSYTHLTLPTNREV